MEPEAEEKKVMRTKRRSRASKIGVRRKGYWKTDNLSESTPSNTTSDLDVDHQTYSTCTESVSHVHICSEVDTFSETATEFYQDTEVDEAEGDHSPPKKKRRIKRKKHLAYRRKQGTKRIGCVLIDDGAKDQDENVTAQGSDSTENSSDSDTDISDSDISLPDDLSLSDIDVECFDVESHIHEPSHLEGTKSGSDIEAAIPDPAATVKQKSDESPSNDPEDFLLSLLGSLKLLLTGNWMCDIEGGKLLRVINLNSEKNAAVDACIYYEHEHKTVGLFVHGLPVPKENKVFRCDTVPDSLNMGSLADYLSQLSARVILFQPCGGIKDHQDLWDISSGFLDYSLSLNSPHFRSAHCDILIHGKRHMCLSCQSQKQKFERQEKRREKEKVDPSSIPDKHLSMEGMKAKKDKYYKMSRGEKLRADRLQRRVNDMQIKLDEALKDEFSSILRANQHKMSPLQKAFWEAQCKVLSLSDKRGMRWHPMLIRLAWHLHSLSPTAFEFINTSKVFTLPSSRRLYDYSHFVEAKEGCQAELTRDIKTKISKCGPEDHYSFINLEFDEMHIRSGLVISRSTGELIGYTKLTGVEEEIQKMQDELNNKTYKPRPAKKVLVYLAEGITSNIKDVVAVYSTDDLSSSQLYERTWEVIYHLEDAGIKVLSVTCDGASINRKFIQMHESLDKSYAYTYCTKNLASGDSRPLFFVLDPPHLLKAIRNAFGNSFAHKKSRKLWKNNQFLSWKVIETLYELTKKQKFRGHKLTKAHIKLTSFSCMTVRYATQVLSNSVAKSIEDLSNHDSMKLLDTSEVVIFIRLMNKFFDCVNGKVEAGEECTNPDKAPFTNPNDERLNFLENDFLDYFEQWKEDIKNRPGIFTESERNRMIISHQALGALQISVKGIAGAIRYMLVEENAPAVCARVFNQDPLEQYFSKVRRKQGDNRNPTLKSVLDTRLNLHAQGHAALPSAKGNTEAQKKKQFEVDSSPLPSRKVRRKTNE
ncbi:Transposable element P transposase [Frankliniella fusca]|uniref:Transposable element P transposase n=1 Tax=Frankliniella fusca TaxID=407009 RepID=A0AAE1HLE8_9NEOP|nr:Transposable element P transposase [Frankliniella fusca]